MLNMLVRSRVSIYFTLVLVFLGTMAFNGAYAANENAEGHSLVITSSHQVVASKNGHVLKVAPPLALSLKSADEFHLLSDKGFMLSGDMHYWLLVRQPSRLRRSAGYCGAGTEDYLYLLRVRRNRLSMLDSFYLQSCLSSFSIDAEKFSDFMLAMKLESSTGKVEFRQISYDRTVEKQEDVEVTPEGGRISIRKVVVKN